VQQHRRQEEDRGVEIQDSCDERDERERDDEQRAGADRQPCELRTGRSEETVTLGDDADEQ
jgi:hypothetical protein